MKKLVAAFLVCFSFNTYSAWDGVETDVIETIQVTHESNYAYRVTMSNDAKLCGNENNWAYLNKSDSNYNTYVSVLTAAKFSQARVTIYSNRDNDGYCRIGYITVR